MENVKWYFQDDNLFFTSTSYMLSFHTLYFCLLNVLFVIIKVCIFHITRIKVKTWIYGNINIDLFIINILTLASSWVPKVALVDTIQGEDEYFRHQKTKITSQKKVPVFHVLFHDSFLFHVILFYSQTLIIADDLYSILNYHNNFIDSCFWGNKGTI